MNIKTIENTSKSMAYITSQQLLITDSQSALDLMATVKYETSCTLLPRKFFLTCTIPLFRLAQKPLKILLTIFKLRHEACSH